MILVCKKVKPSNQQDSIVISSNAITGSSIFAQLLSNTTLSQPIYRLNVDR